MADSVHDITVEWIQGQIAEIKAVRLDDEKPHRMEDALRGVVLHAIASGVKGSRKLAAEVLKTDEIEFSRYCA